MFLYTPAQGQVGGEGGLDVVRPSGKSHTRNVPEDDGKSP